MTTVESSNTQGSAVSGSLLAEPGLGRDRQALETLLAGVPRELFIDGEWRPAAAGNTLEDRDPATEDVLATVSAGGPADVDAAVLSARRQFDGGPWSSTDGPTRGAMLNKIADLIERDAVKLASIQCLEGGQPLMQPTLLDIPHSAATFRYFAGWADKIEGRVIPTPGYMGRRTHSFTVREPVGVLAAIVPWNAPLMIVAWKLAPALAAGCTVIVKPSEEAMLTVQYLGALISEAGVPGGTVNILPGYGETAGAALVTHEGIDKISFTGSPEVGRTILQAASKRFTRVTLELGGKSPQIILDDADLSAAMAGTAMGLFWNQGQICAAGTRVLAQRAVYLDVVDALADQAREVRIGDPLDPQTTMGAQINAHQRDRVLSYIEVGKTEGATLVTGGNAPAGRGYFVSPTVFAGNDQMRIAQEEIFGPVGTIIPFDTIDDAIKLANSTRYGLAATVWTRDMSLAHYVTSKVRAGAVSVNGWAPIDPRLPWGGVKGSGIGRELGWAGIEDCTEEKVVTFVL